MCFCVVISSAIQSITYESWSCYYRVIIGMKNFLIASLLQVCVHVHSVHLRIYGMTYFVSLSDAEMK